MHFKETLQECKEEEMQTETKRERGRERGTESESHYLTDWRFDPCLNVLKGWKIIAFKRSIQTTWRDRDGKRGKVWLSEGGVVGVGMVGGIGGLLLPNLLTKRWQMETFSCKHFICLKVFLLFQNSLVFNPVSPEKKMDLNK